MRSACRGSLSRVIPPVAVLAATLCLSEAGKAAVTATKAWDVPFQGQALAFAFTPDGAYVFSAGADRAIRQWRVSTGELVRTLDGHGNMLSQSRVTGLSVSSDGALLASAGSDATVRVWDVAAGTLKRTIRLAKPARDVHFVPGSHDVVTVPDASARDSVKVFDAATGAKVRFLRNPKSSTFTPARRGAVSPDGTRFASFHPTAGWVVVWDLATGDTLFYRQTAQAFTTHGVVFSPDGAYLLSAHGVGPDKSHLHGTICVRDAATGALLRTMTTSPGLPRSEDVLVLAFADSGTVLAASAEPVRPFPEVPDYAPDGLVVRAWDVATGDSLGVIGTDQPTSFVFDDVMGLAPAIAVSPGGRFVAMPGPDEIVSPDRRLLVKTGPGEVATVILRDVATGETIRRMAGLPPAMKSGVHLHPGGGEILVPVAGGMRRIAIGTGDTLGVARRWATPGSTLSPDGRYFVTVRAYPPAEVPFGVDVIPTPAGDLLWNPLSVPMPSEAGVVISDAATGDSLAGYRVEGCTVLQKAWLTADGAHVVAWGHRIEVTATVPIVTFERHPAFFVWNRQTGVLEKSVAVQEVVNGYTVVTPSPDGNHFATVHRDYTVDDDRVTLWSIASGDTIWTRRIDQGWMYTGSLAFSPDGTRLAVDIGQMQPAANLYDAATGQFLRTFTASVPGRLNGVSFSPDGSHLLLALHDGPDVEIFRCETGVRVGMLRARNELAPGFAPFNFDVFAALVTPGGDSIVVATGHDLQVWSVSPPLVAASPTAVAQTAVPRSFALSQNAPNPFNPSTIIRYSLAQPGAVRLAIYDVTGRHVRTLADGPRAAGVHEVAWDGRDARGRAVASGVYVYRLVAGKDVAVRRMVVVR